MNIINLVKIVITFGVIAHISGMSFGSNTKDKVKIQSALCKPYFASIKRTPINLHVGPGVTYKVLSTYVMKNVPVLIDAKYDHWRRIVDPTGTRGWLQKNQLSSKRYVISTKNDVKLVSGTNNNAKVLATISKNVVMKLEEIRGDWCYVKCNSGKKTIKGWIRRENVFGTLNEELGPVK